MKLIERMALWAALGLVLGVAGLTYEHWAFWCVMVLAFVIQWTATKEGREDGAFLTLMLPVEEFTQIQKELHKEIGK
jgi:hypothetical protein